MASKKRILKFIKPGRLQANSSFKITFFLSVLRFVFIMLCSFVVVNSAIYGQTSKVNAGQGSIEGRGRISINEGLLFMKYTSEPDTLIYDERPSVSCFRKSINNSR